MLVALVILFLIIMWICLPQGNNRKGFLGVMAALVYFPIGVILALTKKYK